VDVQAHDAQPGRHPEIMGAWKRLQLRGVRGEDDVRPLLQESEQVSVIEEVEMSNRFWISSSALAVVMTAILLVPTFVAAQATSRVAAKTDTKAAANTKAWTLPRTLDGQPDLQGYWTSLSFTPMERPAKYRGREFLTDEEVAQVYKEGVQHSYEFTFNDLAETPVYDATVYALSAWQHGVAPNRRTSLVVDPPDGKIPPLTPEGRKARAMALAAAAKQEYADPNAPVTADTAEDLNLGERCLSFGGPPILPGAYNSDFHIVQGPGYVLIEYDRNSETRIIPLDGRPHLSENIHRWHGESRGHWEGNTLVVETTNFRPGTTFQGANAKTLKITEYFTRMDQSTIEYKFTIDDPTTWTKPWSAIVPLSSMKGPMFEYACSEGNNDIVNILAGARAAEKTAAAKAATGGPK
jgi:hypothetical protein